MRKEVIFFLLMGVVLSVISVSVISMYAVTNGKVVKIDIARSEGIGTLSKKPFVAFEYKKNKKETDTIVKAIRESKRIHGKVDARQPDYEIKVTMKNKKTRSYYLWLDQKTDSNGMIMYDRNIGTGHKLSEKATKDLKAIIGRQTAALCKAAVNFYC